VLAALALAASPPGAVRTWSGDPPDALLAALAATPAGGARAAAATRGLVSAPYLPSALGEADGRDPDPRFRLDAFDCLGLVETAVALGSSATLDDAERALDDIRYAGPPALGHRHHEVLSQWIPENLAKGWIADANADVAGARAAVAEKVYSEESWEAVRRAGREIRGRPRARLPVGRFAIGFVPAADVAAAALRVPDGAIVLVVRADAPDRATRISHAGLVVLAPRGGRVVRHATSSRGVTRVIEEPLARFLAREAHAYPRWPLAGLSFFTIRDNRARVTWLAATDARPPARPEGGAAPARPGPQL
jgi:Protein of unknown function (DUF1460)